MSAIPYGGLLQEALQAYGLGKAFAPQLGGDVSDLLANYTGLAKLIAQMAPSGQWPTNISLADNNTIMVEHPAFTNAEALGTHLMALPSGMLPVERDSAIRHELRHNDQERVMGAARLFMKPIEALFKYGSGPLERDAFLQEQPTHELLRQETNLYTDAVQNLFYLLLGGNKPQPMLKGLQ